MLTEYQKGWISGIIDTDGCLCFSKHRTTPIKAKRGYTWEPKLQITSTDRNFLEKIREMIGEGGIRSGTNKPQEHIRVRKHAWSYDLWPNGLRRLLPNIRLVIKERQRVLLLEALTLLRDHQWGRKSRHDTRLNEIYWEMRSLNGTED